MLVLLLITLLVLVLGGTRFSESGAGAKINTAVPGTFTAL